jgi:hypothetical protein
MATTEDVCKWGVSFVATYLAAVCPERLGVVFDIDDTLLSAGTGRARESVIELYQFCVDRDVRVYIVTARPESSRETTLVELAQLGIVAVSKTRRGFQWMAMMPDDYTLEQVPFYKLTERRAVASELGPLGILMLSVGDQWWDIVGSDYRIEEMERLYPRRGPRVVTALPPQEPATAALMVTDSLSYTP